MALTSYSVPKDVERRLADMNLSVDPLLTSVQAGHLAAVSCTENDPSILPGLAAWGRTVRVLREMFLPVGWKKSELSNQPLLINSDQKIILTVASGDDATGIIGATPKTRSAKGFCTAAAVSRNNQLDFFPETLPSETLNALFDHETWVLLVNRSGKVIRSEVSRPSSLDSAGRISGWSERIILPELPLDGPDLDFAPTDLGPNFDVEIKRRS